MTWEEAERLMALIREQQARTNATLARIDATMARLNENGSGSTEKIDHTADRAVMLLATVKHARATRKFDEHLNTLLNTVERYISEGRNRKT
jgi:hypothetical protein